MKEKCEIIRDLLPLVQVLFDRNWDALRAALRQDLVLLVLILSTVLLIITAISIISAKESQISCALFSLHAFPASGFTPRCTSEICINFMLCPHFP